MLGWNENWIPSKGGWALRRWSNDTSGASLEQGDLFTTKKMKRLMIGGVWLLVVGHGTDSFRGSVLESIQHFSQSDGSNGFEEPFDVCAGQVSECFEAKGGVFDDDGGGKEGMSGFDLFDGDFFEGCTLQFRYYKA